MIIKHKKAPWGAEGRLKGSVNICPLGPRSSERLKQTEYALCDEERTLWRSHPAASGSPSVRTKQTVFRIYGAVKQREIEEEGSSPIPVPFQVPMSQTASQATHVAVIGWKRGVHKYRSFDQPPSTSVTLSQIRSSILKLYRKFHSFK